MSSSGGSGGGGSPQALTVHTLSFAYNTPGLNDGLQVLVPAIGDIFVDAWFEIDTLWNGTTPQIDVGLASHSTTGMFGQILFVPTPTVADYAGDVTLVGGNAGLVVATPPFPTLSLSEYNATAAARALTTLGPVNRVVPSVFTATYPVAVWVSQDGTRGGAAPGATQGAGKVFVVTATPA